MSIIFSGFNIIELENERNTMISKSLEIFQLKNGLNDSV